VTRVADSPGVTAPVLEGLNDEQLEAVTHAEGPLMVVAGAGTGKTQVVTRRIAWLIASKKARPEQVLALTFTDKAAAEMESRVDVLVPYGFVGATLSTFHAFCDRLVREHAVELGLTSQLRVESTAEILVFLRERLFDLGLERYLPLGNPDTHLAELVRLFDRARNEDVSPERYAAFAAGLLDAAGDDPEQRDRAQAEVEKARAYARYERMLGEAGRIDFGAQIGLALRLLRERPWVLRQVQEQYRWILVDEFQDTNRVQFELVRLLAGARRNLTVVGDDDQSIYRFRGARVENLLEFLDAYPDARQVLLRRNYRSGQVILDHAHRLVKHNDPERLEARRGWDKRLLAQRTGPDGGTFAGTIEYRGFRAASDESEIVAGEIAAAVESGSARAGDFAILARAHGGLDPFAQSLQARGVRFRRVGMRGLYTRPEVLLCLNVLRVLADPDDGAAAYMALADPLFGADAEDLARFNARARRTLRGVLRVARDAVAAGEGTDATREAVGRFSALVATLAGIAARRPTSEVLYGFVTESGWLARLAAVDTPENLEKVQNLNKLFAIVTRVGPLLRVDRVDAFMQHLDLLIELGDDPAAAEVETDEDAVQLLTAHGAKGLEFPVVYLVHLVEQRFPPYPRGEGLELPPELHTHAGDRNAEHYREERRLFYVGMTRARDRLVLCHAVDYGGKRAARPSRFLQEALALPALPKGAPAATALESIARYAPVPEPPAPEIAPVPDDQPLTLSHAQIDDYLTCPLKYFYAHLAHVPLAGDPSFMYGNAIHHAIKVWHQHRMRGLPIEVGDVISAFEGAWSSEGFLTREHEERLQEQGRDTLRRFVARDVASGRVPAAIEQDFKFRSGTDVVQGRWDRIDDRPEGIVLVDYKSSELDDPDKAAERAKDSLRNGQLGLYALAHREMRGTLPASVELHFVGPGLVGSAAVEEDHLDRARERVAQAAAGIRAARFPARPDQRNCGYCAYRLFCPQSAARRIS
jgi:DNA helicase-2/ATP-dependent DNA helicase PcrA